MDEIFSNTRRMRKGGWFWIDKAFIRAYGGTVGLSGVAVYNCLAFFANSDQTCFPSQGYIARLLGCSRATVNKAIKNLAQNGLITVEKRAGSPQTYQLLDVGCKAELQGVSNESTADVKQIDTNKNHLTSLNNDPTRESGLTHSDVAGESKGLRPAIQSEPLALELAEALDDHRHLSLYLSLTGKHPEPLLRNALDEAVAVPQDKIRKSRAALFIHLIGAYETQQTDNPNH